jgi:DNA-binding NarL/FixJ family response regulator
MTTNDTRPLELAQTHCTPAEQDVLRLEAAGLSERNIALALDISRRAVRDRLWNARRKIDIALRQEETRE